MFRNFALLYTTTNTLIHVKTQYDLRDRAPLLGTSLNECFVLPWLRLLFIGGILLEVPVYGLNLAHHVLNDWDARRRNMYWGEFSYSGLFITHTPGGKNGPRNSI